MRVTRREFLPSFAALVASIPTIASAEEPVNKRINPTELEKFDPTLVKFLRWVDPNLSGLIINLLYYFIEPLIFHHKNYKKLKNGIGNITEADLIHNNSDRWANAMASTMSSFLAYSARFPFTAWAASSSTKDSEDIKRQNKVFSDFMTINTYYGQILADRYLTNAFQHELREVYKKVLKEEPGYGCKPWAIPLSKNIDIIREIYPSVAKEVSSDLKTSVNKLKDLTVKPNSENLAIKWVQSRRNQLDLLLIFLSYISTFADIVPLTTANKIKVYTANTATGRTIASFPALALLSKDLLKRLKNKGDIEGYNETKVMSAAYLYNAPIYYVINSSIQSVVDTTLDFKKYSDSDIAYSNLREIIGAVTGSIIYLFVQYKLESLIRSSNKESDKDAIKRGLLSQFADWYIEPDSK